MVLAGIAKDTDNSKALATGRWVGTYFGFEVWESNNVVTATPSTNQGSRIMFGDRSAINLAVQKNPTVEAYRPEGKFADAVKGLVHYGAKVTRPSALGVLHADYTAEST